MEIIFKKFNNQLRIKHITPGECFSINRENEDPKIVYLKLKNDDGLLKNCCSVGYCRVFNIDTMDIREIGSSIPARPLESTLTVK